MKRMAIPTFLAAGVLAFTLAGCSSGGQAGQAASEDTLKGLWQLDSQSELGFDAYVEFEDEQYAEMIIADSWLEGTWDASGSETTLSFDEDRAAKLTYSNGKLTMGGPDGSKLVFVKDETEGASIEDKLSTGEGEVEDASGLDMFNGAEVNQDTVQAIDPVAVADDGTCVITVTGKGTDSTGDPGYVMSVTNKLDKAIFVIPDDTFKVGDKELETGFTETIEPGQTVETFIYFAQDELEGGVEALAAVDGAIYVGDDETGEEIATYPVHID